MLINLYEEFVSKKVGDVLNQLGMCECEMCKDDVCAYALNRLPPRYIVTTGGGVFSTLALNTDQAQAEIITALYTAAKKVGENPRHIKAK